MHVVDDLSGGGTPCRGVTISRVDVREVVAADLADADVLVHLAGDPSVAASERRPRHAWSVHVGGTEQLLGAAVDAGVRRFVYVSSAAAAAGSEATSPYAEAKRAAERAVFRAARHLPRGACVARPFNVYGRGQRHIPGEGPVVPAFLDALQRREPLPVRDLDAVRDFVHVADVARALVTMVECGVVPTEPVDLGTGVGTTIGALARRMCRLAGATPMFAPISPRREAPRSVCDPRAALTLGFRARVRLPVGLRTLVAEQLCEVTYSGESRLAPPPPIDEDGAQSCALRALAVDRHAVPNEHDATR